MITSHQNKTHVYYRKDGNKLCGRKIRIIQFRMEELLFNHQVHRAIHTPLVYIQSNEGYGK